MMDLQQYWKIQSERIDNCLKGLIPPSKTPYGPLFDAARYSLLGPGKRLRPILTLATTEALTGNSENALIPACAIELIHTYSLIHDDLPCMDNDDFRRGQPTLHKVYTEAQALLAGDFLLTHAFGVLASAPVISDNARNKLIALLAEGAGGGGMIGGQWLDMLATGQKSDLHHLNMIHSLKTGALIATAIDFGAVIGEASQETAEGLREYGQAIGLAFQIVDDILDITTSGQKHGKLRASDSINGKTTYVCLMGVEASKEKALELVEKANDIVNSLPLQGDILKQIASSITDRI